MTVRLTATLTLLAVPCSLSADPVSILLHGGAASPVEGEPDVRMVSEELSVKLFGHEAVVTADMLFRNEGPTQDVELGFPQINYYQTPELVLEAVQFVVDGREVLSRHVGDGGRPLPGLSAPQDVPSWHVATVSFAAGQERRVRITYRHEHGGGIYGPFFPYVLSTGASWKGHSVERIRVVVDYGEAADTIRSAGPKGYETDEAARRLTWLFEDYRGTPQVIGVGWRERPLETRVNGQAAKVAVRLTADGPMIDVATSAPALGYSWDEGRRVLEARGRQVEFPVPGREARVDGQPVTLARSTVPNDAGRWSNQCLVTTDDLKRLVGLDSTWDPVSRVLDFRP
jgi:hypothetical protein